MSERWVLIDHESGLHVGWYFWLRVLDEVNRSQRYGAPFGLLLLEAEAGEGASRHALEAATSQVPGAIRGTDLGGRMGLNRAAVLLMNQNPEGARAGTQRILERMEEAGAHGIGWRTRLLSYPEDGGEISMLLTTGWQAEDAPLRRPA